MKRWPIDPDPRPTLLDLMRDPGTEPRFERPGQERCERCWAIVRTANEVAA